jgi:F420-dependent oxidoreductase-like protein
MLGNVTPQLSSVGFRVGRIWTRRMRLSIQTPQYGCELQDILTVWRAADTLGFRSAWLMDHLVPIMLPDEESMLEAWTAISALLAGTDSIRAGVLVSANTFRHPSLLARMAATVDRLSGGRLEVGLGAAWCEREHQANGIHFPNVPTRLAMLDESAQVLRLLWTQAEANFEGVHYQLRGAKCEPKPLQDPLPLLFGGRGERRTLRTVARWANGWNGSGSVAMLAHSVSVLRDHCNAIGRDPNTITLTARNDFIMSADTTRTTAHLERLAAFWGTTVEDARDRSWVGEKDQIVDWLLQLRAIGFDEAILGIEPPYEIGTVEMLTQVAEDLAPIVA